MTEHTVPISKIVEGGDNVRHEIGDVTELAESIKRFGILQPLVVVPSDDEFILVAGHRRLAAARVAKLDRVPIVVHDLGPDERVEAMLSENLHRKNLTVLEEAEAFRRLMKRDDLSQQQLADRLGITQTTVSNKLAFLRLSAKLQRDVLEGHIGLQRALAEHVRVPRTQTRKPWSERKAVIQGQEMPSRVFVLVVFGPASRPEQVRVFTDRERAFDVRDQLARDHKVLVYPCEVDTVQGGGIAA